MTYSHRPTDLPNVDRDTDRSVYCDGEFIARIYKFTEGALENQWGWFGQWAGDNVGYTDTLDEALKAVKERHKQQKA